VTVRHLQIDHDALGARAMRLHHQSVSQHTAPAGRGPQSLPFGFQLAIKPVFVVSHIVKRFAAPPMAATFLEGLGLTGCLVFRVSFPAEIV
jgi:hypothetical protein